ncbi:carboxymuconolactone decarboxylase family protein [Nocardia crassostreae]|uniref:carboxymuconolactone decarboxylase family protein n=1 Tax=Nocardia crassostreae TaxID=53428 RepID=UPI000835B901|nr:carboxymuconolactone decarboxylase family protein [Nocardia crassostreae]
MYGLPLVDPESSNGETDHLFATAHEVLGVTPNLVKAMANSPAALAAYLDFQVALRGGTLCTATHERIALLVAQENECDYELSVHSYLGAEVAGLSAEQIAEARRGRAETPAAAAELTFATALIRNRGAVTDAELAAARDGGLSHAAIAEVIAHIALNVFTTYLAKVGRVDIDWPLARHGDRP